MSIPQKMLGLTVLIHSHQLWPGQPPLGLWVKDPSNFGICGLAVTALNTTDSPTSFWKGQGHIDFGWFWMILGFKISLLRIKESKVCLSRMLHVWLEFWGKASCLIREACWNSTCLWHNAMFTGFFKFWCFLFYLLWLQFTDEKTAEPDARRILVDNFAILPFSQSSCLKVSCLCHWKASSHLKSTLIPHSCRWNSIFWGGKIHIFRWKPYFLLVKQKKIHLFRSLEPGTTQAGVRPGSDAVSFISLWQRLREHNHHKPFNIMPHLEMCFPMTPCNFRLVRMVRSEQTLRCLTLEALVLPVSPPLFIPEQQNYHRCLLGFYNFYMIFYDDKLGWL